MKSKAFSFLLNCCNYFLLKRILYFIIYKRINMGYCWAVGCNHHNQREKCKFFTLPKDTKSRNRWLKLLK